MTDCEIPSVINLFITQFIDASAFFVSTTYPPPSRYLCWKSEGDNIKKRLWSQHEGERRKLFLCIFQCLEALWWFLMFSHFIFVWYHRQMNFNFFFCRSSSCFRIHLTSSPLLWHDIMKYINSRCLCRDTQFAICKRFFGRGGGRRTKRWKMLPLNKPEDGKAKNKFHNPSTPIDFPHIFSSGFS